MESGHVSRKYENDWVKMHGLYSGMLLLIPRHRPNTTCEWGCRKNVRSNNYARKML